MSRKRSNNVAWIWIILIVVLILIIYLVSLGKVNLSETGSIKEFKDTKEQAKNRYDKLIRLIEEKEGLKQKLNRRFRLTYFAVRIILSSLFIGYNLILFFVFEINKLGDLLNWNELFLIGFALVSFLTFGSVHNLNEFILNLRIRLENFVYGKYVDIDKQITKHIEERESIKQINLISNI